MIHTARQSPKFIKLVRRLRAVVPADCFVGPESVAIAILERLWHATATGALRGDIGRFDDEVIAESCGWQRDAGELIEMLLDCGWLDASDEHRLVVHDWHDHAPKHVKGNAQKLGGIVTEAIARPGLRGRSLGAGPKGGTPKAEPLRQGAPNQTKPNITKPVASATEAAAEVSPIEAIADPVVREAVEGWVAYKAERRERPKPRALAALCSQAVNAAAENGAAEVARAMAEAQANGWKGWTHTLVQPSRDGGRGSPQRSLPMRDPLDPRGAIAANQAAKEILRREREKQQPATA